MILLKTFVSWWAPTDCANTIIMTHNFGPLFIGEICTWLFLLRNI